MIIDKYELYDNYEDFFKLHGNKWMKLSRQAAKDVCNKATAEKLIITWIDGGIWHFPGFEPRDTVWHAKKIESNSLEDIRKNNLKALQSINDEDIDINAFIIGLDLLPVLSN